MSKRIESLDYFRGLMALSVMLYHYTLWYTGDVGFSTLLGKLGIYAVSIFYILSGVSLGLIYQNKLLNLGKVRNYFIKRFMRIAPLFWLSLTIAIIYKYIYYNYAGGNGEINIYHLFLNYTLIFGFVEPSAYFSTGAWSIGNEIVFYCMFPFAIFVNRNIFFALILPVSFAFFCYFSFIVIQANVEMDVQWANYVNPLNQSFLFFSGVGIALIHKQIATYLESNNVAVLLFIVCFIVFLLIPVGQFSDVIYGWNRVILSVLSILMVMSVFFINFKSYSFILKGLLFLGTSCYSIYLLHPLVNYPIVYLFNILNWEVLYAYILSVCFTLVLSKYTYMYLEKPMMIYSKKLTQTTKHIDHKEYRIN